MESLSEDEQKQVLGEVLFDQLKAILEYVSVIPTIVRDLTIVKDKVNNLESDMNVMKALYRDHEKRITRLENNSLAA